MVNNDHEKDIEIVRKFVAEDKNPDMLLKIRELNMALEEDKRYIACGRKHLTTAYGTIQDTKEIIVVF